MQWLMNVADASELPSQSVAVFAQSSKQHWVLYYPDWRVYIFCWLLLDTFHGVLLSVDLIGNSICWNQSFGFLEGVHNGGLPSSLTMYTVSPSLDEAKPLVWLVVVLSLAPQSLLSTILYSIHFSSPATICFKNGTFSLCLSRKSHVEIWSRKFSSLSLCGTQTSKWLT